MIREAAVLETLFGSVGAVVEEKAAADEPPGGGPVVDAVFQVGCGAEDISGVGVVVEGAGGEVGDLLWWGFC